MVERAIRYLKQLDWAHIRFWSSVIAAGLLFFILFVQLVWPYDRFFPWQTIDGEPVGLMTYNEAKGKLSDKYLHQEVEFMSKGRLINKATTKEVGINVDVTKQIDDAAYNFRERVIPFSILWKVASDTAIEPATILDTPTTANYLDTNYNNICTIPAANATITIENNKLTLVDDTPGLICDENLFMGAILENPLTLHNPLAVEIRGKEVPAFVTTAKLQDTFNKARDELIKGVVLQATDTQKINVRYGDIVKWLNIQTRSSGFVTIDYSDDKIRDYIDKVVKPIVNTRAGITLITTLDDVMLNTKDGTTGREMDTEKLIQDIKNYLESDDKDKILPVPSATTNPSQKFQRSYSKNSGGLQMLFKTNLPGGEYGVKVKGYRDNQEMGNQVGEDQTFQSATAASIFSELCDKVPDYKLGQEAKCQKAKDDKTITTTASEVYSWLEVAVRYPQVLSAFRSDKVKLVGVTGDPLYTATIISRDISNNYLIVAWAKNQDEIKDGIEYIGNVFAE
jgi:hypothetical protein